MQNLLPWYKELNGFFDHVYVMTIRRATERHEKLKRVLDGLDYEFLWGADNKEFSVEELKRQGIYDEETTKRLHRYGKSMNPGALGCAITQKMAYEDMIQKGYKTALFFEDDIMPNEEGLRLFPAIRKELPPDWDLIYFDYDKNTERNFGGWVKQNFYHLQKLTGGIKYSHTAINHLYAKPYSKHLKKAGYHDFASAYGITRATAQKFVEMQTPIVYWADHVLAVACANQLVDGYLTVPKLFIQESQFNKEIVGSYAEE